MYNADNSRGIHYSRENVHVQNTELSNKSEQFIDILKSSFNAMNIT